MKGGSKKCLLIFGIIFALTLLVLIVIRYEERLEQKVSYEDFSNEKKEGYYEIKNIEDYIKFAETVSVGNTYEWCEIHLNSDLDFTGMENMPVIGLLGEQLNEFKGIFNGNGHLIQGLSVSNPEGVCGIFACLGGIVKNLRIENCTFEGKECGAITAQSMVNAAVVNCQVEANVSGEVCGVVAGDFKGYIFNCVANSKQFTGKLRNGWMEQCYYENDNIYYLVDSEASGMDAETVKNNLNAYMPRVSAFHKTYDLFLWEIDNNLKIGKEKAEVLENVTAKLYVHNEEITLKGYYSEDNDHWCIAVPAGYGTEKMRITAKTTAGMRENFPRTEFEDTILYTQGAYHYFIDFLSADTVDTVYIQLSEGKELNDIHKNKNEEISGVITTIDQWGGIKKTVLKGIYGHGNDSWAAPKKSYNLKLDNLEDFLGMGENEDFVLVAGYRDDSLMSYVTTTSFIQKLGFEYAPEFRLVNLYIEEEYLGVYFLVEKIELDKNRIEISNLYEETKQMNGSILDKLEIQEWKDEKTYAERYYYEVPNQPLDLTGGYLLEFDKVDFEPDESRFVSERGISITMKRARYSSKEQVEYISGYWQEFENALYSETGKNTQGKHYSEYIDMDSFVMQWLLYELVQEGSMSGSIYFYKESDVTGDGLLHACFPWDMEHSYLLYGPLDQMWFKDSTTVAGYWSRFLKHEDFREKIYDMWKSRFCPAIEYMTEITINENEIKNISWYETNMRKASEMETSRWRKMNPYERCEAIRTFLNIRKDVLSTLLSE